MPSEVLGFWRMFIAAVLLTGWVFWYKKMPWPKFEKKLWWLVLSGVFFFLHLWSYKYAAKNTSIANTMILFSTNPVWATAGSILLFNEKLTFRVILAYILAIVGIVILLYKQMHFHGQTLNGDMSALISALFYSAFMLAGKKSRQLYPNLIVSNLQYVVCAFLFLIVSFVINDSLAGYDRISWTAVIGQVLIPTFLGHFLMTYLVQYMDLSLMTCGKLVEPIFAAIIAYFVFNETLHSESYIAFGLTATALLILFWPSVIKAISANVNTR